MTDEPEVPEEDGAQESSPPEESLLDAVKGDPVAFAKQLSLPRQLVLGGCAVYLLASFLPWWSVSVKFFGQEISESVNGWNRLGLVGILGMLGCASVTVLGLMGKGGDMARNFPMILLIAAGLCLLATVGVGLDSSGGGDLEGPDMEASSGPSIGYFLAFLSSLAISGGAYLNFQGHRS